MRTTRYLFAQLASQNLLYKSPTFLLLLLTLIIGCALPFGQNLTPEEQVAVVTTDKGIFVIELYPDAAPVAVDNFTKLINQKFYDGLTFHRRVDEFVVQGGCPNGDGTGGPGWNITDEYTHPNQRPHLRGTVAMARTSEPNSSGSQFYICFKPQPSLDGNYTTFGGVIQGMDVVDRLQVGDVMTKIQLEAKLKYVKATAE
ncbi:peptidylprolyl isomerase [Candidatus Poribacteria bacterium]|nr:peptidylprolyl isomerase [Candidatus Poribacteria bacterium]MYG05465.1 peptidylprolyl isomerase [Candidatus Poribacteria bacterium]MYK23044.1 peptidylprolyl isomerase [Candidatus Poribacteria bacterium]